jgi:hypothetical protein
VVFVWPSVGAALAFLDVLCLVCPVSVRGARPSSTDEDVSAIDKVHEHRLVGFCLEERSRDGDYHLVLRM